MLHEALSGLPFRSLECRRNLADALCGPKRLWIRVMQTSELSRCDILTTGFEGSYLRILLGDPELPMDEWNYRAVIRVRWSRDFAVGH